MMRDNFLDVSKLSGNKDIFKIFKLVERHGGVVRFVGGAVRDALKGIKGFDLDLATDLSPDELVEACQEEGIRTIPIGIKYGTVGVIINDTVLEVTSLRKDIKTDGRHAEVEFTDNWEEDASRRDLTINAVYADEKGNVFDYYNGIEDLEKGRVRFIGSPSQRIREDYLRILRFFRFYSIFGVGDIDRKALQACVDNREGLKTLSMERIRDEMFKILLTPNAAKTLQIMMDNGILSYIMPDPKHLDKLNFLSQLVEKERIAHDALRRLFLIYQPDVALAKNLSLRLRLSKKQKNLFIDLAQYSASLGDFYDEKKLLRLAYLHGKDFCAEKLLLLLAETQQSVPNLAEKIENIQQTELPEFPLHGKDLIDHGIADPKQIGATIKELEKIWLDSGLVAKKDDLLDRLKEFNMACGE